MLMCLREQREWDEESARQLERLREELNRVDTQIKSFISSKEAIKPVVTKLAQIEGAIKAQKKLIQELGRKGSVSSPVDAPEPG